MLPSVLLAKPVDFVRGRLLAKNDRRAALSHYIHVIVVYTAAPLTTSTAQLHEVPVDYIQAQLHEVPVDYYIDYNIQSTSYVGLCRRTTCRLQRTLRLTYTFSHMCRGGNTMSHYCIRYCGRAFFSVKGRGTRAAAQRLV